MKVQDVMMRTPAYCNAGTDLGSAIEILWNRDCGILPIVDANRKVIGVVTDRDLCVALGTRNKLPGEITVGDVRTGTARTCRAEDGIRAALEIMATAKVRRLPVVNKDGQLEGILSMDNVVLHADPGGPGRPPQLSYADIVNTLQRIYGPQLPQVVEARAAAR